MTRPRDPMSATSRLDAAGGRPAPPPRTEFADTLERDLRVMHTLGATPDHDPARDWRPPIVGWALAVAAVLLVGWLALGAVDGTERVDVATSNVDTTTAVDVTPAPTAADPERGTGTTTDTSTARAAETTVSQASGSATADSGPTESTVVDPTTSAASTTEPATDSSTTTAIDRPTTVTSTGTTPSATARVVLEVIGSGRRGDELAWTVSGPGEADIVRFELTYVTPRNDPRIAVDIEDPRQRSITVDRPVDGAVGYRILALDAAGRAVGTSGTVRVP